MLNLDRRQFLLGSAAAGAFAFTGCATTAPRTPSARARALYDEIFNAMLEASPEMATGLGLDTGARAHLKRRLSDQSRAGKMGSYRPMIEALPRLRRLDRAALSGQDRAWLDTVIWVADRVQAFEPFPYGSVGGYSYPVPYVAEPAPARPRETYVFMISGAKVRNPAAAMELIRRL